MAEKCPVCKVLGQKSQVKRLQPLPPHDYGFAVTLCTRCGDPCPPTATRYRYSCSKGHEFDGARNHYNPNADVDNRLCDDCYYEEMDEKKRSA